MCYAKKNIFLVFLKFPLTFFAMMRKLCFLFFCLPAWAFAQSGVGSWNIYHAKIELNSRFSVFLEPQLRSLSFYQQYHYYELKCGVNYRLNNTFGFSLGMGDYNTYQAGGNFVEPKQNKELRTWAQMNLYNYLQKLKIEHRYRVEQRFGVHNYQNRFRYRFSMTLPIFKHKVEKKTLYINVSDELFLGDDAPFFQRNRFFVGLGYEFTPLVTLQAGWMNQFDYKINDETGKNFLQIALLMNFRWQKKSLETVPSGEN